VETLILDKVGGPTFGVWDLVVDGNQERPGGTDGI
jgi:hypothetical protein